MKRTICSVNGLEIVLEHVTTYKLETGYLWDGYNSGLSGARLTVSTTGGSEYSFLVFNGNTAEWGWGGAKYEVEKFLHEMVDYRRAPLIDDLNEYVAATLNANEGMKKRNEEKKAQKEKEELWSLGVLT